MLSQLFRDLPNRIDMMRLIGMNQDIVYIDNDKILKL